MSDWGLQHGLTRAVWSLSHCHCCLTGPVSPGSTNTPAGTCKNWIAIYFCFQLSDKITGCPRNILLDPFCRFKYWDSASVKLCSTDVRKEKLSLIVSEEIMNTHYTSISESTKIRTGVNVSHRIWNYTGMSFLETSRKVVMHFKCACKILMHMYYCLTYDFNYDYYFNDDSVKMRHFFIYTING